MQLDYENGIPILSLQGEIDIYTCPDLHKKLKTLVDDDKKIFILDLNNIHYIDSTGLGTIAHAAHTLQNQGGKLYIICTKPQVIKIFEVSGLQEKNICLYENKQTILDMITKENIKEESKV
jgi:anti-sigma B factor antagonist